MEPLVRALLAKGIDAWFDRWEIRAGESLVKRIFSEGIPAAGTMVVVLSKTSVSKPWVQAELEAGIVRRIENTLRLIPVVLDGVEVPAALKAHRWISVGEDLDCGPVVDEIVASVFDLSRKPALGRAPGYTQRAWPQIGNLEAVDVVVLKAFGDVALETGEWFGVMTSSAWEKVRAEGLAREEFEEAVELLDKRGFLERSPELSPFPLECKVTVYGLESYLEDFYEGYAEVVQEVVAILLNEGVEDNEKLHGLVRAPALLVDHVLRRLGQLGRVRIYEASGGFIGIEEVGVELKRWLRQGGLP
ncbi:MAG: toll/interleukin-1 receptor domain-containing protein, partial [Thermoanaerobaculia bacterium]|nr:toll/interleukin-1 receptor domain-containing protein [Thermoanaerobaculia bacterium]